MGTVTEKWMVGVWEANGHDRLPSNSMVGRSELHSRRSTFVGWSGMAFGLRCIARHSFLNRFDEVASMP